MKNHSQNKGKSVSLPPETVQNDEKDVVDEQKHTDSATNGARPKNNIQALFMAK
jgi:hypothetical protein